MSDLVEETLHAVARPVEVLAEANWVFATGFGRNVRQGHSIRDHLAQRVGNVTLVGQSQSAFGEVGDHLWRAGDVGVIARSQLELDWLALIVDDRLDFCREAAPAAPQTTISTPFLTLRHVGERERRNCRSSEHRLHLLEYLPP